jgi:hypothetical protein
VPVVNMRSSFRTQSGSAIRTNEITFAPTDTFGTVALTWTTGGGAQAVGIVGVRSRPRPDGDEVSESFGEWPDWRSSTFRNRMTSVTWGIATGSDQTAKGLVVLHFFG